MTDRELMQQALEALELLAKYENPQTKIQVRKPRDGGPIVTVYPHKVATDAAAPLRERLAREERPDGRKLQRMRQEAWRKTDAQWKDDPELCFALGYEAGYNDAVAPRVEPRSSESGAGFESLPASPGQLWARARGDK